MRSSTHAILSELHRLLSSYDRDDFLRASDYTGLGSPLRQALLALASEPSTHVEQTRTKASKHAPISTELKLPSQKERQTLADSILKSEFGASIASLRKFATEHGLKLEPRIKESKERVARRLAGALEILPEARRNQILSELFGTVSKQTQGWINVIKGTKR